MTTSNVYRVTAVLEVHMLVRAKDRAEAQLIGIECWRDEYKFDGGYEAVIRDIVEVPNVKGLLREELNCYPWIDGDSWSREENDKTVLELLEGKC